MGNDSPIQFFYLCLVHGSIKQKKKYWPKFARRMGKEGWEGGANFSPWPGHEPVIRRSYWARVWQLLRESYVKHDLIYFYLQDKWSQHPDGMECFHDIGLMALDSTLKCAFSFNSNCQTNKWVRTSNCVFFITPACMGNKLFGTLGRIVTVW